ncbi:uncharacterized protein LOC113316311 [Papaver somniferum]|uniref:uncharacterized protein LOC113316311 n=1 Tax=Papaver somniferum TaxID=3469 RepID=UPI000E6FE9AB|nr:uncharacterized protein LOC113316311 [Papaver somniferum]
MAGWLPSKILYSLLGYLEDDVMLVFKELQDKCFMDWRLKNSFVALVPKKETIEEIKDLRPISLIHGMYKIISKVLAHRFKEVLPSIISSHQSAFIKKRPILDEVLVANELIDSRRRSGKAGLLVKVDFEKAFDHVRWDFLDEILALMNFGEKWRKWVRICEAISFMIKNAQEQGFIAGFQVTNGGKMISHLQFADDTLIFLDADIDQIKHLRLLLLAFEQLTGLKINFAKSQNFGVGYDGDLSQFYSLLGCYNGMLPTTYLGLPLGDKSGGVDKWDKVVDKFTVRLYGWNRTMMNRAGKIILIKNVLSSLPVYYMSLFVMPVSVAKKLGKIMRNFLWNDKSNKKKMNLVKWPTL